MQLTCVTHGTSTHIVIDHIHTGGVVLTGINDTIIDVRLTAVSFKPFWTITAVDYKVQNY